jgi:hypothetical protein
MAHDHDPLIQCNHDGVAAEVVDGEAIILNLETGAYYSLDGPGARVWQLVELGRTAGEITRTIAEEYGMPPAEVERDVAALITGLADERLVTTGVVSPSPAQAATPAVSASDPAADEPRVYRRPELRKYTEMADMLALDPPLPGLRDIEWKRTPRE